MPKKKPISKNYSKIFRTTLSKALLISLVIGSFLLFSVYALANRQLVTNPDNTYAAITPNVYTSPSERAEMRQLASTIELNRRSRDAIITSAERALANADVDPEMGSFAKESRTAVQLAWAYDITGQSKYADAAIRLMNRYKSTPTANPSGTARLSWGYRYSNWVQVYDLVKSYSGFSSTDKNAIKANFRGMADSLWQGDNYLMSKDNCITNSKWFTVSAVAGMAVILEDQTLLNNALNLYPQYLVSPTGHCWVNSPHRVIDSQGYLGHEMARFIENKDNTWYYSGFSMAGMVGVLEIARQQGRNLWEHSTPDGRNMRQVFNTHIKHLRANGTPWPHKGFASSAEWPFIYSDYVSTFEAAYAFWADSAYDVVFANKRDWMTDGNRVKSNLLYGPSTYLYNGRRARMPGAGTSSPIVSPRVSPSPSSISSPSPSTSPRTSPSTLPANSTVNYQRWNNIVTQPNALLTDLTNDPRFPNSPTLSQKLPNMNAPYNLGTATEHQNFGSRMFAYLKPPASGNYTFYLTADDTAELFLSTNQDISRKRSIAKINRWMNYQDVSCSISADCSLSQRQSEQVSLAANSLYYIEVVHAESIGEDHVTVWWQTPGSSRPVVIPSSAFIEYTPPAPLPPSPSAATTISPSPLTTQSSVSVYARGTAMDGIYPVLEVYANETKLGQITTNATLQAYTLPLGAINSSQVQSITVNYINDGYRPSPFVDRNAFVDKIIYNGITYESESSATYSTGTWTPSSGCSPGNKSSEELHCNGYFKYFVSTESNPLTRITVRAKGTSVNGEYAKFQMVFNSDVQPEVVETSADYVDYVFYTKYLPLKSLTSVRVNFTNDLHSPSQNADRNLSVDYIKVNDQIFQTESDNVISEGIWTSATGCNVGNKRLELISCPGYVLFPMLISL